MGLSDLQLVDQCARGSSDALAMLSRRYVDLVYAAVRCGNVSIRLIRVTKRPHDAKEACAYFYVDAGAIARKSLRDRIAARGVDTGAIGSAGQLMQFDVVTPDGFTLGFYSQQ